MGRGGPREPQLARAGTSLDELRAIAARGPHAASDYLEDAALAGVPTVGCRRVGGGLSASRRVERRRGRRARRLPRPGRVDLRGLGRVHPACRGRPAPSASWAGRRVLHGLGSYHLMRSRSRWRWAATASWRRRSASASVPRSRASWCRSRSSSRPAARAWPSSAPARPPAPASSWWCLVGALPPRRARCRPGARGGRALRRLPGRAQGRRDRHGCRAAPSTRAPACYSCATAHRPRRGPGRRAAHPPRRCLRRSSTTAPGRACPTRRASWRALSASGLSPDRSYELARRGRAPSRGTGGAAHRRLRAGSPDRGRGAGGGGREAVRRFLMFQRLDRLDRPLS